MNRTFSVGNVLATGFKVWFRNIVPFLLITGLFYAPPWIWAATAVHGDPTPANFQHATTVFGLATMLTLVLNVFVSAALTYGVVMELHGQRASVGACITTGLVRFFPALGVGVLIWLCFIGGCIALVVPGVIIWCMLYVATQASVLERPGLLGALHRSRELTRGHKLEIFGLLFILGLLGFVSNLIVRAVAVSTPHSLEEAFHNLSMLTYLSLAHQIVTGSLAAVMASVAYYLLRAEKEGTSTAELAAIFD